MPPNTPKTYAPHEVSVIFGATILSGYMTGTFIEVARNEKLFNQTVGVDGEGADVKSNNKSGTVKVTLMQTSLTNQALSTIHAADEISNAGVYPLTIKDNNGFDLHFSPGCRLEGPPDAPYADNIESREWTFICASLSMNSGGANVTPVQ